MTEDQVMLFGNILNEVSGMTLFRQLEPNELDDCETVDCETVKAIYSEVVSAESTKDSFQAVWGSFGETDSGSEGEY